MNEDKETKSTRETLLAQDDRDFTMWAIIITPIGKFVGPLPNDPRDVISPIYEIHRGLQVDQRGNAMVVTKILPVMLYPEIDMLVLPEGSPVVMVKSLHPNSRGELYGEIKLCRENVKRMKMVQDGVCILLPGPNGRVQ